MKFHKLAYYYYKCPVGGVKYQGAFCHDSVGKLLAPRWKNVTCKNCERLKGKRERPGRVSIDNWIDLW